MFDSKISLYPFSSTRPGTSYIKTNDPKTGTIIDDTQAYIFQRAPIITNLLQTTIHINVPGNFLQLGYIDLELECPTGTAAATLIGVQAPLSSFYINLVIVDEDLEKTKDNILAPLINYDINTNNYNRGKLYN